MKLWIKRLGVRWAIVTEASAFAHSVWSAGVAFPIDDESAATGALPSLDAASRSILQLLANGESYDEAACILGLDREAVDRSMSAVRRRLCATTDEHAVAIGLRLRLID